MGNCDPCSAAPLNQEELRKAGVFWLNKGGYPSSFITRLHLRYSRDKFPEDLQFRDKLKIDFVFGLITVLGSRPEK